MSETFITNTDTADDETDMASRKANDDTEIQRTNGNLSENEAEGSGEKNIKIEQENKHEVQGSSNVVARNKLVMESKPKEQQGRKALSDGAEKDLKKPTSNKEKEIKEGDQNLHKLNQELSDTVSKGSENEKANTNGIINTDVGILQQNRNTESSMISYESGGKPPKNTPAHTMYGSDPDGRVHPMYVRFPGQRHGLMMFAEMNQQAGKVRIVGRDKEKEMLARLSWLLLDAGTTALKHTFDSIHPPAMLQEHLSQTHIKAILKRLHSQGVIDDKQWKVMYPMKNKSPSSYKFHSRTLVTLLETICHLCPPYPNGWSKDPLVTDTSLSADIVRLQLMYMEMTRHDTIPGEVYAVLFTQIRNVLLRLAGPPIRIKLARIEQELINLEMQTHYIQTLRNTWRGNIAKKLDKIHEARTRTTNLRKTYTESKGTAQEGLSPEDKVTLTKTYKLFMDNVPAEDVIDRLQQSQVIKFSDRQEILSYDKKSDRIQVLLEKIMNSKLPYALKALIDAIKFKYKKVYEQVQHVRKVTHKEGVVTKIDTVGLTQEALRNHYRNTFSKVYPFSWSETIHASIRDIFTPVEIIDENGNKVHQSGLLPPAAGNRGQKISLQGASGSGKTLLCAWIAYMWAVLPQFFKNRYEQVLYLNAHELKGNLESAIYRKLLPDNFKLNMEQFWNMLETRSHEVLVLLDGFDQSDAFDVSDIIAGTRLRHSTIIMAVNPNSHVHKSYSADRKWFILGFNEASIKRCLKTCVTISRLDPEPFERLYKLVVSDKFPLKENLALPILVVKIFAIFSILKRRGVLKEMKTECDVFEKYGGSMASLYCKRNKIDVIGFEFPDEILGSVVELERFAYKCLIENRYVFSEDNVLRETENPIVLKLGAFVQFTQDSKLRFSCGVIRDFLAAKYLADMTYGDLETAIVQHKMVKLPRYTQVMSFLCGQYRQDYDTPVLRVLFEHLAARNEYCIRGNHLPDEDLDSQPGPTTVVMKRDMSHGALSDFKTSLYCLSECPGREDAIETIALSFPTRLVVKANGVLPRQIVEGLQMVLGFHDCPVTEIVIELNQCHMSQLDFFLPLATAIGKKETIKSLSVSWSSLDMMAKFLEGVTSNSTSLETVVLTEDIKKRGVRHISAATWAALQLGCSKMVAVKKMAFLGGRSTAVVNHVIQHIPRTIAHLDLAGCAINLMCAGELSCHFHGNTKLEFLDLSNAKLNSAELVTIIHGLQLCESIRHVRLCGITFDRSGVIALSEFLRLTHSLAILDLSDCQLTDNMCLRLAAGVRQNRSLRRIILKNTEVTSEGRRMFTGTKLERLHFEGLPELNLLPVL